ncbi:DUF1156 domain-containing protein [Amylibacter sp.]|nr:DUF1156 domain-containing protein [Amylibacter sp.]MDC0095868.1 DUF1156 domain-containing protein [Amylibacter sp.]
MTQTYKKKLIEVAIPLEAINAASAREKSIRQGHPSTLHLWWARRPLATCRAVLFAQLVDDPSSNTDKFPTEEAVEVERERLFGIIEELVKWENSTNEELLEKAHAEILKSCDGELPSIYDPFSGGGSIPLEAQRLGLPAYGSDLNPVAVILGKAMVEIPPKFKDFDPIHPGIKNQSFYRNAEGMAEDLRFYADWMRKKAMEKIGNLYPEVDLPQLYGGGKATVVAWIWARTVPSPDPAFSEKNVPIASSFLVGAKKDQEAWIKPIVNKYNKSISYEIVNKGTKDELEVARKGTKLARGANFFCLYSGATITPDHIKKAGKEGKMGQTLICIVAAAKKRRLFLSPDEYHIKIANAAEPNWMPELKQPQNARDFRTQLYGMETFGSIFTKRQLVALNTYSEIAKDVRKHIENDAKHATFPADERGLAEGGTGHKAYAEAIAVYLSFGVSKLADMQNSLVSWKSSRNEAIHLFTKQAIPMTWDFAEPNIFSNAAGDFAVTMNTIQRVLLRFVPKSQGHIAQVAAQDVNYPERTVISTDPPYYDNIGYADLSDFFYVWLKPLIQPIFPQIFNVLATPKSEELVASPDRHGGKKHAEEFFLNGMKNVILRMKNQSQDEFPAAIYYAFKQSEITKEGMSSTGWATFLEAIIQSGYSIVGTWPMRTEMSNRMVASGTNALANSVVLVCRKKNNIKLTVTRAEFIRELKRELPGAISKLQSANVSPADMPQSSIGPGMAVFSKFDKVLEVDDLQMTVKTALQLINSELDEFLNNFHGDFDPDTRFSATWFEQNGYEKGDFGAANSLATARGISVDSVKHAGIVESSAGKVRILKREELDPNWEPNSDTHLTVWECCQYLVREYEDGGETAAAMLIKKMGFEKADAVKDLAYYLYDICSNKRQDAKEATSYNALIAGWNDIMRMANSIHDTDTTRQASLF